MKLKYISLFFISLVILLMILITNNIIGKNIFSINSIGLTNYKKSFEILLKNNDVYIGNVSNNFTNNYIECSYDQGLGKCQLYNISNYNNGLKILVYGEHCIKFDSSSEGIACINTEKGCYQAILSPTNYNELFSKNDHSHFEISCTKISENKCH